MYSRWHWTRDQEDAERLPYGMVRTAYDADTRQYSFLETTSGDRFVSAPGEAYGTLVPAATANFPRASRSNGRRSTLQAYDRPVIFADDPSNQQHSSKSPSMGHKRTPTMPPSSSRHHPSSTSGSTRKQGRKRSASFSDFLPPHLIARASNSPDLATAAPAKPRHARVVSVRSAPPSPPPYVDDEDEKKKSSGWWSSSSPTEPLLRSLPTVSAAGRPPPLPPKDYPVSNPQQQQHQSGGTCTPRVGVRLAARVFGRTMGAVKGGQRSPEGDSDDKGWVVV